MEQSPKQKAQKKYYEKHKEQKKAYAKEYYQKNKVYLLQKHREQKRKVDDDVLLLEDIL